MKKATLTKRVLPVRPKEGRLPEVTAPSTAPLRHGTGGNIELLELLGTRVRRMRARRGMTRKLLARYSGVSERYLAQIETGKGNISLAVLQQLASSLGIQIEALIVEGPDPPVEFVHTVEFLRRLSTADLRAAHQLLLDHFAGIDPGVRNKRIALVGLRGAGKSTLGGLLGERLGVPFLELDRLIEMRAGVSLSVVFELYGQAGFRRLERECLDHVLERHSQFVMATGGSLVSEPATFEHLLNTCFTIWLQATPEEHMGRVINQGDMRPMDDNSDAMADLKRILEERAALYGKADLHVDTSAQSVDQTIAILLEQTPFARAKR